VADRSGRPGRWCHCRCFVLPQSCSSLPQPKPKRDTEDALHTLLSLRINLAPSEPGMTKFPSERYKQRTTLIGTLHHLHHENAISWSARPTSNSSRELQITSEAPRLPSGTCSVKPNTLGGRPLLVPGSYTYCGITSPSLPRYDSFPFSKTHVLTPLCPSSNGHKIRATDANKVNNSQQRSFGVPFVYSSMSPLGLSETSPKLSAWRPSPL
jgi:hypothetical protein